MLEMEVDTARLQRQQLQDELHARQQERRKRHDEQQKDIHLKRRARASARVGAAAHRRRHRHRHLGRRRLAHLPSRSDSSPPLQSAQSTPSSHGAFGFGGERPRMRSRTLRPRGRRRQPIPQRLGFFCVEPACHGPRRPCRLRN